MPEIEVVIRQDGRARLSYDGRELFHGGKPGLEPGDFLLPPNQTGLRSLTAMINEHKQVTCFCEARIFAIQMKHISGTFDGEDDWVYASPSIPIATVHAAVWTVNPFYEGKGSVYRIRPEGRIEQDRHKIPPGSWQMERAVVVEVLERDVPGEDTLAQYGQSDFIGSILRHLYEFQHGQAEPNMVGGA
jgi:hypothetical protein